MRCGITEFGAALLLSLFFTAPRANADPPVVEVQAQIQINYPSAQKGKNQAPAPTVLLWLTPVLSEHELISVSAPPGHFRMVQKNKSFEPHLLVVSLGSTVSFPNHDPFFHNVFSQFNGKRFDLGLYEAGDSKDVQFNHEGVSYLFCNIHPEMSAVVVTLATPYFVTSTGGTAAILHRVPPGTYELQIWAEGFDSKELAAHARRVHIGPSQTSLGVIQLDAPETIPPHKNKFGEDYRSSQPTIY